MAMGSPRFARAEAPSGTGAAGGALLEAAALGHLGGAGTALSSSAAFGSTTGSLHPQL
jgi:hypothetical protein